MMDLNNEIARLEIRSEQVVLHLRCLSRNTPGAKQMRSTLLAMLLRLVALKGKRQRLESHSDFGKAA